MINNFAENADEPFLSDKFSSDNGLDKDNELMMEDPQNDDDVDDNGASTDLTPHDNPLIWVMLIILWDIFLGNWTMKLWTAHFQHLKWEEHVAILEKKGLFDCYYQMSMKSFQKLLGLLV